MRSIFLIMVVLTSIAAPVIAGNPDRDGGECEGGCGEQIIRVQNDPAKGSRWRVAAPRARPERKSQWLSAHTRG